MNRSVMALLSRQLQMLFDHICCTLSAGIDLENIVYYRDNTHYFVMTAKKQSLLDKGVIINVSGVARIAYWAVSNVHRSSNRRRVSFS